MDNFTINTLVNALKKPIIPSHPHQDGVQSRRVVPLMAEPYWSSSVKWCKCCAPSALKAMCQFVPSRPVQSLACYSAVSSYFFPILLFRRILFIIFLVYWILYILYYQIFH